MLGKPRILSLFRNEFNKFNNTRARTLDSIKITLKSHFCRKNVIMLSMRIVCNVIIDVITSPPPKSVNR